MRTAWGLFLIAAMGIAAAQSGGVKYSGCVMTDVDGNLTFCEPDHCSLLTGEGVSAKISGHVVTVEGSVTEAANGQPRRIAVAKIVSVGAACDQTCALYAVHHRGIGPKDKPGSEGATPGATKPPQ